MSVLERIAEDVRRMAADGHSTVEIAEDLGLTPECVIDICKDFGIVKRTASLCFDCQNACCGCSWSRSFVPVPGWMAVPTVAVSGQGMRKRSYRVIACPEFVPDGEGVNA